jgi:spermidine synthase
MLHSTRRSRLGDLAVAGMMLTAWLVVPRFLGTRLPADFLAGGGVLVDFREGRTADAAVVRTNGLLQLQIDRWWQGEERKTHQAVSAHLVMQLHPNPRSVLVVGAGTGQTARRFLEYPIDRLDVVDIEPVVFDLIAKHFDDGWMSDPRVALIRDDGRNLVAHTDRSYDVIALEVGQIFRPGVASFYTTDFYSRARARLRDGGRLAQFVPLAFLTPEELRSIVASFIAVFPESVLWYNSGELLLIGAHGDRIGASDDRLALLVEDDTIHADLRYSYWGDRSDWMNQPDVLLAGFLSGAAGLAGLSADAETYRDDRPVLEYEASRAGRSRTAEIAIAPLLREHLDPLQSIFDAPLAPERSARIVAQREQNLADLIASAHVRRAEELGATGDIEGGLTEVAKALRQNPSSVPALRVAGNLLVAAGRIEEARGRYLDVLRLEPADPLSLRGLGRCSLAAGQVDEAIDYYESALAVRPNDAETRNNLGALRASRRELRDALIHFREAVRLNPHDRGAQENLQRLETLLGSTQDGRELLQTRAATPAGTISAGPGPPPDPR